MDEKNHILRKKELRNRISDLHAIKKYSNSHINKLYINKEIAEYTQLIEKINNHTQEKEIIPKPSLKKPKRKSSITNLSRVISLRKKIRELEWLKNESLSISNVKYIDGAIEDCKEQLRRVYLRMSEEEKKEVVKALR